MVLARTGAGGAACAAGVADDPGGTYVRLTAKCRCASLAIRHVEAPRDESSMEVRRPSTDAEQSTFDMVLGKDLKARSTIGISSNGVATYRANRAEHDETLLELCRRTERRPGGAVRRVPAVRLILWRPAGSHVRQLQSAAARGCHPPR